MVYHTLVRRNRSVAIGVVTLAFCAHTCLRPTARILILIGVVAMVVLRSHIVRAASPMHYDVQATVDEHGMLRGSLVVRVAVEADDSEIVLWVYPDRLAVAPSAINEQSARWIYPRELDLSEVSLTDVAIDGSAVVGRWRRYQKGSARGRDYAGGDYLIRIESGTPRTVEVSLDFAYRLPERYGRIGRVGRRISLTGPWYPLVVDGDAFRHRATHEVQLRLPEGMDQVRGDTTFGYVPVAAAPRYYRAVEEVDGVQLRIRSPRPMHRGPSPDATGLRAVRDLIQVDVVEPMIDVLRNVLATLRGAGIPIRRRAIEVVIVPSRTEMASTAPGLVLVADRIYEIFPLDDTIAFHNRVVRRAFISSLLEPLMNRVEPAEDRAWAEDLRAILLSDLDDIRRQGRVRTVEDLIGWAGFHQVIDQLLYAPQVAFVDVYFGSVAEHDPYRDAPWRARQPTSRGRRILESARDLLPEERFRDWTRRVLRGAPAAAALRELAPAAAERLPAWLRAAATEVNYRLGAVETRRRGQRYEHTVHVHREGDERVEPVEVAVWDGTGESAQVGRWDGPGAHGTVRVQTDAPLTRVQVDPRRRLPQSPAVADGHPFRDDSNRLPFRPPIFQNFSGSYNASTGQGVLLVDFALRRRYDLENAVALRLDYNPRGLGGFIRYLRGVGRKRDTNNRVGLITTGLAVTRLFDNFVPGEEGGWRFAAVVSGGYSTRRYFLDPRDGASFGASLRAALTRRDGGRLTYTIAPSLRGNLTVPLGLRAALVLVGGGSWVFGEALAGERPSIGSRFLLAGYAAEEVVGRGLFFAATELRFTPTALSDLQINLLHVVWVREIQLAAFARAGVVFDALDGRSVAPATEVGLGVRVHFEYAGVQPAVFVVDVSAPLVRTYESRQFRNPISLLIAFEQYF